MRKLIRNIYLSFLGYFFIPKKSIHVLNSHYVTSDFIKNTDYNIFDNFLKTISKHCKLISIQEATNSIYTRNTEVDKPLVAFTFDDGFEECYTVIAPLLEKYNIKGAFFINANYIQSTLEYQKQFNERIALQSKKPMTWEQITDLHKRGHVIGSHNLDHTNMAELNEIELDFQINENKKILEHKLNYSCDYFAWTYGQMKHFPKNALKKALKFHKYIFSATNYKNYFSMDNQVINRRHVEANWPKTHINYFLSVNKKM
jgi:hypothetical protein